MREVIIPDLGGVQEADVIELLVKPGERINAEQSVLTLESDKASMEIPSPYAGVVKELKIAVGSKVKKGTLVLLLEEENLANGKIKETNSISEKTVVATPAKTTQTAVVTTVATTSSSATEVYASPATRRMAREMGISLQQIAGQGRNGRILPEDIQTFVQGTTTSSNIGFPSIDHAQFGAIETQPLSKIKKITAKNLQRNWSNIPHVTQFDEADITELEAFRVAQKAKAEKQGYRLTLLPFIMKAVVAALQRYQQFNASLSENGEQLILKKYFHLGVAVDTPNGLVVPVVRDIDKKGVFDIAKELAEISQKAREKGLSLAEMQGSSFTISSLGGVGGTAFTPIVNWPDVAILGVSKAQMKPVYQDEAFVPRLILPLSLSYDHRVIDGAEGARFIQYLADVLTDWRSALL